MTANHLEILRAEAECSLCRTCKGPLHAYGLGGYPAGYACPLCDIASRSVQWCEEPIEPFALELACRWALERIAELEALTEAVRDWAREQPPSQVSELRKIMHPEEMP